jgi:sugar (glycoside-pentoside-hexuronide) transporter
VQRELTPPTKAVYALGDFTVNTALSSLSLIYAAYFLTQVAGLPGTLAGLVPLIGRFVDAVTDPAMGRLSDVTRLRAGRRRPYFLIGAIPFGVSFALLWQAPGFDALELRFAYYTLVYCTLSISMTVLSVPYLALLPEMARGYDDRTSLNAYRNVGSVFGIIAAVGIRPLANALGGGSEGFALAGMVLGSALALPWLAVHRVSFERPAFRSRSEGVGFLEGLRLVARHRTFIKLMGLYLCGRIAMDLIATLMILYFTFWLGRSEDFEPTMFLFLTSVVLSLLLWLRVARYFDKSAIFIFGCSWWMVSQLIFLLATPEWPRWVLFVYAPLSAIGYAAVDLMPWSMVGDVIDEDDVATGERREGVYNGVFTFLRKLGGAIGVFLVLGTLDLFGLVQGELQSEAVRTAVRLLTALGPMLLLALAIWIARGYPLTRSAHGRILETLEARGRSSS